MSRNNCSNQIKDCVIIGHDSDTLVMVNVLTKLIMPKEALLAIYY
jgi:hypothetical protein